MSLPHIKRSEGLPLFVGLNLKLNPISFRRVRSLLRQILVLINDIKFSRFVSFCRRMIPECKCYDTLPGRPPGSSPWITPHFLFGPCYPETKPMSTTRWGYTSSCTPPTSRLRGGRLTLHELRDVVRHRGCQEEGTRRSTGVCWTTPSSRVPTDDEYTSLLESMVSRSLIYQLSRCPPSCTPKT